jgi:pyrimidine-nucleoside phosphorylase
MSIASKPKLNAVRLIEKKRHNGTHTQAEINALIEGLMSDEVKDYQMAAWLMAVCLNGLNVDETTWLTEAFVKSGHVLDLSGVQGTVVDKHSTGGVGDKTTLVIVPLLASAGLKVAKLSGRGLGFTGGTIDKLEAIPGFRVEVDDKHFIEQLNKVGCVISSQSKDFTPADALIYKLRDVTATVDNLSLIAASVVSKKIVAGAEIIVLDIKYGRGAFMKTLDEANALADLCREVGERLGKALLTEISPMEEPLGLAVGNALEVLEAVQTLKGQGPKDLEDLSVALAARVVYQAGLTDTLEQAVALLKAHLHDGSAFATFKAMVKAQHGDVEALEDESLMQQPDRISLLPSPITGTVQSIDPLLVAQAVQLMGGGRMKKEDKIHHGVGVVLHVKVGSFIEKGDTLLEIYAGGTHYSEALALLSQAFVLA